MKLKVRYIAHDWSRLPEVSTELELDPRQCAFIITAFYHTDLEMILRTRNVNTLFFSGVTTSVCVESTLRDAFHRDFRCILLNDGVWEKSPDLQKATEKVVMLHFGYVTSSSEVLSALGQV